MSQSRCPKSLEALFESEPLWRVETLAEQLNYSVPSVRRFLVGVGHYTSFTHNGRWHTLRWIPRFDRDGLWFREGVGFSRQGKLTDTLVHIIDRSPAGMSADALGGKLGVRCHGVLARLYRCERIQREKEGRAYVYLSADQDVARQQYHALMQQSMPSGELPAEVAVLVFAEFIRHPDSSFECLADAIRRKAHIRVSAAQINRLFEKHQIKKNR